MSYRTQECSICGYDIPYQRKFPDMVCHHCIREAKGRITNTSGKKVCFQVIDRDIHFKRKKDREPIMCDYDKDFICYVKNVKCEVFSTSRGEIVYERID